MLIESIFWSLGFIIIISISENLLLSILGRNMIPEQFYLAIGAGIWEELVFRVGLIGLILIFMKGILAIVTQPPWIVIGLGRHLKTNGIPPPTGLTFLLFSLESWQQF